MVELAGVTKGKTVLEPNGGHGAIATTAREAGGVVTCVELDPDRADRLSALGFTVIGSADFLSRDPEHLGPFDLGLMNPPPSREQDALHVAQALRFVRPGGRLVAVTGPSWRFRTTSRAVAFRELMVDVDAEVEELPEGTFRESGTMVRSLLVQVDVTRETRVVAEGSGVLRI
jgi:hypothetical protein